tara:strand:+ start:3254 stop:3871 length:618 start_codon:yes stop_codon:yes gene_type:complete
VLATAFTSATAKLKMDVRANVRRLHVQLTVHAVRARVNAMQVRFHERTFPQHRRLRVLDEVNERVQGLEMHQARHRHSIRTLYIAHTNGLRVRVFFAWGADPDHVKPSLPVLSYPIYDINNDIGCELRIHVHGDATRFSESSSYRSQERFRPTTELEASKQLSPITSISYSFDLLPDTIKFLQTIRTPTMSPLPFSGHEILQKNE